MRKKYSDKQKDIGLAIFDLAQNGEKIFEEATVEEKRILLNTMFSNLYLFDGKMRYEINPAFKVMHDKVTQTNDMLIESSGIVKITDINPEKPELGKNVDVLDEVEYVTLTNSVIRDIHVWTLCKMRMRQKRQYKKGE